jgi:pimeloyl-ACP methyl ester carboxylesterase
MFKQTLALLLLWVSAFAQADIWSEVEHGYADNEGVKIHYATVGEGPLVVMIHGFPDFWYSWRHQMEGLKNDFKVVAIDQRGYNKSGQPQGNENYAMPLLVSDVAAVIRHFGADKAVVVGHDWGGSVAWNTAFALPDMVDRLVILNLPHPRGLARELMNSAEVRANTNYAQAFRKGKPSDPLFLRVLRGHHDYRYVVYLLEFLTDLFTAYVWEF